MTGLVRFVRGLGIVALAGPSVAADVIHVPADFPTIAEAVFAATNGDEVVVADGVWSGDGNVDIELDGKAITVKSANGPTSCIIDCGGTNRAFILDSLEGRQSRIEGFTIRNGAAAQGFDAGGAILIRFGLTDPTIANCIIHSSTAGLGAAIGVVAGASVTIVGCTIRDNVGDFGGGVGVSDGWNVRIVDSAITGNSSFRGGGVYFSGEDGLFVGGTLITRNTAANSGGGVFVAPDSGSTTIVGGEVTNNCAGKNGGGADVSGDVTTITGSLVRDNVAEGDGGGLSVGGGAVTVDDSVIENNASGSNGGGVASIHDAPDPPTTIIKITFVNGNMAIGDGGGLYNGPGSCMQVLDGTVFDNGADRGGGVFNGGFMEACGAHLKSNHAGFGAGCMHTGEATFEKSVIEFNAADFIGGGMILEDAAVELADLIFSFNAAGSGGGAIGASSGSTLRARRLRITGNTAGGPGTGGGQGGGALFLNVNGSGAAPGTGSVLVNCAFTGNQAGLWGGAMHTTASTVPLIGCLFAENAAGRGGAIYNSASQPPMISCTFTGNTAAELGGAVYNTTGSAPDATSCIFWGDAPDEIFNNGGVPTISYSDMEGGVPPAWDGGGNIEVDPQFVDANAGDYRLAAGSPCVDAADGDALPAEVTLDIDGRLRFIDDPDTDDTGVGAMPYLDMGSHEFQTCAADVTLDGEVGFDDLLAVLSAWGAYEACPPAVPADVDHDCTVGFDDLLAVLSAWGPCG